MASEKRTAGDDVHLTIRWYDVMGNDSMRIDGTEIFRAKNVKLIAPYKFNRKTKPTKNGRELRRYKRRRKIERLFA